MDYSGCCNNKKQQKSFNGFWREAHYRARFNVRKFLDWENLGMIKSFFLWLIPALGAPALNQLFGFSNKFEWQMTALTMIIWGIIVGVIYIINLLGLVPNEMYREWQMKEEGSRASKKFSELDEKYRKEYLENPQSGQPWDVYRRIGFWPNQPYYQEVEKLLNEHKCFNESDIRGFSDEEFLSRKYRDRLNNEVPTPLGLTRFHYMTDLLYRFGNLPKNS